MPCIPFHAVILKGGSIFRPVSLLCNHNPFNIFIKLKNKLVIFRAPINAYTGYGLHACQIVQDLKQMGLDVWLHNCSLSRAYGQIPPAILEKIITGPERSEWELILYPPGQKCSVEKKTIYFTMWESSRLPDGTSDSLNKAECVIVPNKWNASCFLESGIRRPIEIVPLGINTSIFQFKPIDIGKPCTFGTGGRLESGGVRKGIKDVIALFRKAFPKENDVRLRIKIFPDCSFESVDDPRIDVTRCFLSETAMKEWFAELTCFVSASRGEGWGLMQQQALAVGRPLIAARFGGVAEFFSDDMGYPVDFTLTPGLGVYKNCGYWAEPNGDHMIERMREVYNDRTGAARRGRKGANGVSKFSWQASNEALVRVLRKFNVVD